MGGIVLASLLQVGGMAIISPRDAASGQATGKRTHKPLSLRFYYDSSIP